MGVWRNAAVATLSGAMVLVAGLAFGGATPARWWAPGEGRVFPTQIDYPNDEGSLRVLLQGGPMPTRGHPFFKPLGPNGRACVTCHQPADAMSLSAATARARWDATGGRDPLFAAYDGSNCPTLPQGERASHSLLLDHGLIRIQRPWPPRNLAGEPIKPDFTIEVVRDPWGCDSGPKYGPAAASPNISVYRRPRPVANMKYLLAVGFAYDPKQGMPLPLDPESGRPMSGNLMADGRAGTLNAQMGDAASTHLEFAKRLSKEDMARILDFEQRIFTAQQSHGAGGDLDAAGALGGPRNLAVSEAGQLGSIGKPVWSEFEVWEKPDPAKPATPEEKRFRESVARGAKVFRDKTFLISDSAGINSPIGFGNPVRNSCVFCHNMSMMGNDVAPGQVDLGTTTAPFADPAPHLPLFRIRCLGKPHPHYGREILTSDPGYALTTGRCADVGKITLQSLRGLAARAPYFSNGSAKDLRAVVDYYDRRYRIGYSDQEKQDLVNLMSAL
jgi:cytochrome c peroxidase